MSQNFTISYFFYSRLKLSVIENHKINSQLPYVNLSAFEKSWLTTY
jgi:hypothetical protein